MPKRAVKHNLSLTTRSLELLRETLSLLRSKDRWVKKSSFCSRIQKETDPVELDSIDINRRYHYNYCLSSALITAHRSLYRRNSRDFELAVTELTKVIESFQKQRGGGLCPTPTVFNDDDRVGYDEIRLVLKRTINRFRFRLRAPDKFKKYRKKPYRHKIG